MSDPVAVLGPKRFLAVDDEPHMAELIVRVARKEGYEARPLVQTTALVQALLTWRPHMISLDLKMSRVGGTDVFSLLKVMRFDGQIIIISGLQSAQLRAARGLAEAGGLKVAGELVKPVDIKVLGELLQQLRQSKPRAA